MRRLGVAVMMIVSTPALTVKSSLNITTVPPSGTRFIAFTNNLDEILRSSLS